MIDEWGMTISYMCKRVISCDRWLGDNHSIYEGEGEVRFALD